MKTLLLVIAGVVVCTCSASWVGRYDEKPAATMWVPSRRSVYCVKTGQECVQTSQCCSRTDVCLTVSTRNKYADKKYSVGTCQDMKRLTQFTKPYKYAGEPCSDSSQCLDLCCREVRGHRFRYHVCGKPEDRWISYTCIGGARSENDILDSVAFRQKIHHGYN